MPFGHQLSVITGCVLSSLYCRRERRGMKCWPKVLCYLCVGQGFKAAGELPGRTCIQSCQLWVTGLWGFRISTELS